MGRLQIEIKKPSKKITKATLTATCTAGDAHIPLASSSSGSSFSLLSVQEAVSWTEQVLSKSGKLVDGYLRDSTSALSCREHSKIHVIRLAVYPSNTF